MICGRRSSRSNSDGSINSKISIERIRTVFSRFAITFAIIKQSSSNKIVLKYILWILIVRSQLNSIQCCGYTSLYSFVYPFVNIYSTLFYVLITIITISNSSLTFLLLSCRPQYFIVYGMNAFQKNNVPLCEQEWLILSQWTFRDQTETKNYSYIIINSWLLP